MYGYVYTCRRHYIDVERREDGFDRSGPLNSLGEFTSTRGVSQTSHNTPFS